MAHIAVCNITLPAHRGGRLQNVIDSGDVWTEKSYALTTRIAGAVVKDTLSKYSMVAEPIRVGTIKSNAKNIAFDSKQYRVYSTEGKATTLCGQGGGVGAKTGLYAVPVHKEHYIGPTYTVFNGYILIDGDWYPINLPDGYYIIRKLSVNECKRLQTVPDWYDMSVLSDSQAYKCLGNGWTVAVIMHILQSAITS